MANYTITAAQNIDELTVRTGTRAAAAWTRVTTTATVTLTNHQLATGSVIQVTVSSDTGAITLGSKTVTSTGANTFTFGCNNAGAASGTITFTATDTITINGGTLTIDEDTRYGVNTNAGAALGSITMSASLGGTVEVDARAVRLIPYDTGTGNVPASNTVISQGGVSGKLIGVWSAINVAPTAAGAAMPATGFIKVKQVTGGTYAAGALTGISASATGADTAGWIDLVGAEAATVTVNRLNLFRMRGDWFSLGTTSGSRATTYQLPTSGFANYYLPGVWVETAVADVYEFYPCAGTQTALAANIATDDVRGRFCWVTVASGLLRFGHDGTNSTGGYLPPAGRKIRIPNILTHNVTLATQANYALPNATLATRYDFTTTGGGAVSFDKCSLNWYPSFTQAYSVAMTNTAVMTQVSVSEIASAMTWSQVGVGQEAANSQVALAMTFCSAGGTMTDCTWTRAGLASSGLYLNSITDIDGFTFTNERYHPLAFRGNANTGIMSALRANNCTWNNPLCGGRFVATTCANMTINDFNYYDHPATSTTSVTPVAGIDIGGACTDVLIDGYAFAGLFMCQPFTSLLNMAVSGNKNIKFRNVGTAAAPLSLGGAKQTDMAWTRATSTITVTATAHGLKVGDNFYLLVSSDTNAITVGAKTVATVVNANSFTFTGTNAGAASGTLTYFPMMTANVVTAATGSAAKNLRVQRVYVDHTRGSVFSIDNTGTEILFEDVWGANHQTLSNASLNTRVRKTRGAISYIAQTGCYGSHFEDGYFTNPSADLTVLSWTRATTTATITSAGHGMKTGDTVNVIVSSDTSAVNLGVRTVTVLTSSTFTITATNAGATSGTLTLQQATARQGILMNETTALTTAQVTVDAGTPSFTSAGSIYMPNVNDQATWETPAYVLGYSGFPITDVVISGGGSLNNFDITYAIDTGSGYGSFRNLSYPRAGASGSNGATTFTVTSGAGIEVGDYVYGTNIAANAKVTDVTGNTVTVDRANIGAVSGTVRFNHIPNETINATTGFKLKVRIKTVIANTSAIISLYWWLSHVAADELVQYVLDTNVYTITGLIAGSEVRAYLGTDPSTAVELGGIESSGTSFNFEHSAGGQDGYIVVMKNDYEPIFVHVTYAAADQELLVQPRFDRNYENP